jgi:putative NADH-flavin reductase
MNITVLGANGKTGLEVVRQALAAGHNVFGVVHHTGALEDNPNLHIIVGDATDTAVIADASKGSDVIISTLGTTSNSSQLMTNAAKAVIAAGQVTGCKRYIIMSAFIAKPASLAPTIKLASSVLMKGMVKDKIESEQLVKTSD